MADEDGTEPRRPTEQVTDEETPPQSRVLWPVQIACLITMVALAWIDASHLEFSVSPEWLILLGGIALGPEVAKITHR